MGKYNLNKLLNENNYLLKVFSFLQMTSVPERIMNLFVFSLLLLFPFHIVFRYNCFKYACRVIQRSIFYIFSTLTKQILRQNL